MKLVPENFKLIPTTYNGNDFMKIQYEDKDLVMKLKGKFHIIDVKHYGLRLIFTPDDYSIIDKIHELTGYKNKSELNSISLSMNKTTPFFNHKNWARAVKHGGHNTNELLKSFNLVATAMVIIS